MACAAPHSNKAVPEDRPVAEREPGDWLFSCRSQERTVVIPRTERLQTCSCSEPSRALRLVVLARHLPGAGCQVPGARGRERGVGYTPFLHLAPGTWHLALPTRHLAPGTTEYSRPSAHCPRCR